MEFLFSFCLIFGYFGNFYFFLFFVLMKFWFWKVQKTVCFPLWNPLLERLFDDEIHCFFISTPTVFLTVLFMLLEVGVFLL